MQFLLNREGNISVFRVGLIIGILGIIGIGLGFLSFQLEIANKRQPFHVELFPNAVELDTTITRPRGNGRIVRYAVQNVTPEEVTSFYQRRLDDHLGQAGAVDKQECVRTPLIGTYPNFVEGAGTIPYHYDCIFDNTFLGNTQMTKVRIHPGVRNDAQNFNLEGSVVIIYEQIWSLP